MSIKFNKINPNNPNLIFIFCNVNVSIHYITITTTKRITISTFDTKFFFFFLMANNNEEESLSFHFGVGWIIAMVVFVLIFFLLIVWGWLSYAKLARKGSPYTTAALIGAIAGLFFPLFNIIPIVLRYIEK